MNNKELEEEEIRFLSPRDACRRRTGMYLGSTERADITIREIIDNSCDEISSGYGDTILISNNFNGFCFVADNGRGLPISMSIDKPDITAAELSITEFHSGSKFDGTDTIARVGMNGIGSSAVNFTSSIYVILSKITDKNYDRSIPLVKEVWESSGPRVKKDLYYALIMKEGIKVCETAGKLKDLEREIFKGINNYISIPEGQSTIVLFKPDPTIFENVDVEIPINNLQYFLLIQEKFYKKNVNVIVNGENIRSTFSPYQFEITKTIIPKDTSFNKQVGIYITFEVDPALGNVVSSGSVNGLTCNEGCHMSLVKNLFKASLKDYFKIKHDYLLNGFKYVCIILANECQFNSQTKENLKQLTKVKSSDFEEVIKDFQRIFKKNEDYWSSHVNKLNFLAESMKSLSAIDKAQKIMDEASGRGIYKLKGDIVRCFVDATSSDRWKCNLFLCEGISAAGSLRSGRRDTAFNAILPLRGKVKNVKDSTADQAMDNQELFTIFRMIGLGIDVNNVTKDATSPEEAYSLIQKYSRYGKIIIATDADEDGYAIRNGLCYAFSKFARFIIEFGLLYVIESPIFEQGGTYFYPSDPLIEPGQPFRVGMNPAKHYRRFKGLGTLNASDVYDVFYDESKRRLFQIVPDGIDYAMKLVEDINARKQLLISKGILTNPYNFTDL